MTATCEYDYEIWDTCGDSAIGYFDGFFYCEYHAKHLGKIK